MRALLDVNMLVALFDPGHTHHSASMGWWRTEQSDGWASCALTQNGLLRIISARSYARPVTLIDLASALRAQIADSDHEFWPDDISIADPEIFDHDRIFGPNQITDLYLLALATKNKGRLVTFDRAISVAAVRGAEAQHLAVL